MSIPRFGFLVTFLTYIALIFAEYLRPGFVSNAMNIHVFWIIMIGWIVVEALYDREHRFSNETLKNVSSSIPRFAILIFGFVLALIVWHIGSVFGDMRLFFAIAVGILPTVLVVKCPKKSDS